MIPRAVGMEPKWQNQQRNEKRVETRAYTTTAKGQKEMLHKYLIWICVLNVINKCYSNREKPSERARETSTKQQQQLAKLN